MMAFANRWAVNCRLIMSLFALLSLVAHDAVADPQVKSGVIGSDWPASVVPIYAAQDAAVPPTNQTERVKKSAASNGSSQANMGSRRKNLASDVIAATGRKGLAISQPPLNPSLPAASQMKLGAGVPDEAVALEHWPLRETAGSPVEVQTFDIRLQQIAESAPGGDASAPSTKAGVPVVAPVKESGEPAVPFPSGSPGDADLRPSKAVPDRDVQKQVKSYCANITNIAMDARYLHQKMELDGLRADIEKRAASLEGKISEFKDWLKRREEFVSKARESLVSIYSSMKAEAAAKQLTELDEDTASSVLSKLDARQSSTIMSEMEPKKAARLMEIIAAASIVSNSPNQAAGDTNPAQSSLAVPAASPGVGAADTSPAEAQSQ
jgi:flagellar motility protein MotE (MotC chaperone)